MNRKEKMFQGYYKCKCLVDKCPNLIILCGCGSMNYCCKLDNPKEDCEFWFEEEEEVGD